MQHMQLKPYHRVIKNRISKGHSMASIARDIGCSYQGMLRYCHANSLVAKPLEPKRPTGAPMPEDERHALRYAVMMAEDDEHKENVRRFVRALDIAITGGLVAAADLPVDKSNVCRWKKGKTKGLPRTTLFRCLAAIHELVDWREMIEPGGDRALQARVQRAIRARDL